MYVEQIFFQSFYADVNIKWHIILVYTVLSFQAVWKTMNVWKKDTEAVLRSLNI